MKLLVLFTYGVSLKHWYKSGLFSREVQIYKALVKRGFKIQFVTFGNEDDLRYGEKLNGIVITPFYAYSTYYHSKYIRFLHSFLLPFFFRRSILQSDIIKTNQIWGGWIAILIKLLYKKKLIVRCGYEKYSFCLKNNMPFIYINLVKLISYLSYKVADAIIITSTKDRDFIIQTFSIKPEKIFVVPNYIDTNLFKNKGFQKYDDRIIFVGRLSKEKNLFALLEAIKYTPYRLDIIGDGPLRYDIKSFIKEKGVNAYLLGRVSNQKLPNILNRYPVFVLPSLYEGNPKALLEAMACSCAVIGTKVSGIKEIIKAGDTGLLCEPNAASISNAIIKLMKDKRLRDKVGKNAEIFIRKNNSLEACISRELNIHKAILPNKIYSLSN